MAAAEHRAPAWVIGLLLPLSICAVTEPALAQFQGDVQVSARVLPLPAAREAAVKVALHGAAASPSDLFRISELRPQATDSARGPRMRKVIVVVEFLAN